MNFQYKVLPDHRTIVARYTGVFTAEELMASVRLLWADPQYSRDFDGIVDLSAVSTSIAIGDIRTFFKFLHEEPQLSRGRWAAVATTPFATACSFMYRTAMAGRHPLEIFSTWEAACEFLNLRSFADPSPLGEGDRALFG